MILVKMLKKNCVSLVKSFLFFSDKNQVVRVKRLNVKCIFRVDQSEYHKVRMSNSEPNVPFDESFLVERNENEKRNVISDLFDRPVENTNYEDLSLNLYKTRISSYQRNP